MKCINCGHEWEPGQKNKISACPACGLEAEYLGDIHSYDKAVEAEQNGSPEEAIKWYKVAAEEEAPCAAYAVYRCMGAKRSQQREESAFWLWAAAELGDPLACYELAGIQRKQKSTEVANYYLWRSAESGHGKACFDLAYSAMRRKVYSEARYYLDKVKESSKWASVLLFFLGKNKSKKGKAAPAYAELDEKRVALGKYAEGLGYSHMAYHLFLLGSANPEGLYHASRLEAEGKGDGTLKTAAIRENLAKAGDGGCLDAYVYLAELLLADKSAPKKNALLSKDYYEKAAKAGHSHAQYVLGHIYYDGELVPLNLETALYWFQKATMQGDDEAGECVADISRALSAAEAKVKRAYENGDYQGALQLAVHMADMGHTALAFTAANMFLKGEGCKASPRLAVTYYEKAVRGGSAEAVYHLGVLYAHNHGVRLSYRTAVKLLSVAAENGFADAVGQMELLKKRKQQKQLRHIHATGCSLYHMGKKEEAIRYFLAASKLGYAKSMYMLACFAEFGDGMNMDPQVAETWFKKAAAAGFTGARGRIKSGYVHERKRHY